LWCKALTVLPAGDQDKVEFVEPVPPYPDPSWFHQFHLILMESIPPHPDPSWFHQFHLILIISRQHRQWMDE
jgi:hypothetical protein